MSKRVYDLLEPVVADLGYELWHLERSGGGPGARLRLYIDSENGVGVADCEKVSREVSAVLDAQYPGDTGDTGYELEVSSPGLDRPLARAAHFRRFTGQRARVHMFAPVAGRRKFSGVILAVDGDQVDLGCDDQTFRLAIGDMAKARLQPAFDG